MGDGTQKVIINAEGSRDNLSKEMSAFLDYLQHKMPASNFTRKLETEVEKAIEHKEWRNEYMTFMMKLNEEREEGRAEGRAEERLSILTNFSQNGGSEDDMRRMLGATDDEIQQVRNMRENAVTA